MHVGYFVVSWKLLLVTSRISFPDQGLKLAPELGAPSLKTEPTVKYLFYFFFLMKIHTVLHTDCINLRPHKVNFSPQPLQHLLFIDFMMTAIVTCVTWYLVVGLFFFKVRLFIICTWLHWVFVAVWAFSSCGERGLLFVASHGLLTWS